MTFRTSRIEAICKIIPIKCRSGEAHMSYIDYTARFFAVVGAPYVARRHADAPHRSLHETATLSCSAGSWLNDDR